MSDDQPLKQEDVDAALAGPGGGGDESPTPEMNAPAPKPPGSAASEDRATAGPANVVDESASAASPEAGSDVIDQDDIDALLNDMEDMAGTGTGSTDVPKGAADAAGLDSTTDVAAGEHADAVGHPFGEAAAEMAATFTEETDPDPAGAEPLKLPDLEAGSGAGEPLKPIELLKDVGLQVKIELGRSRMLVEDVIRLGEGSVVELDKLAGDPVDVYVNDRLIARGEVLVLNDNFCVRVNEIVSDLWKEFQSA
jgi:flagellar motor switch protein FliN/FliY